jgi:acetyl-CoA carboxylase biotin carboxyl carrier protein
MSSEHDPKLPDLRYIRELAKVFKQYELDELEIETEGTRMLLRRGDMPVATVAAAHPAAPAVPPTPVPTPVAAAVAAPEPQAVTGDFITSPFVGTFYRASRPDTPAFCEIGDRLAPGQTVCIVEAMKLFNEIEAEFACTVEDVLVENGQPVEYGAKLFRVRKL